MLISLLLPVVFVSLGPVGAQKSAAPISLARVNRAGEKRAYDVKSHLQLEFRSTGLQTWIPEELDLNYGFTTQVTEVKPDGVVQMRYVRPTMTEIQGETVESPPKETVDHINLDYLLSITPINEVVAVKDQSPKKPKKVSSENGGEMRTSASGGDNGVQGALDSYLQQFVGEVYRLALNAGSFDSALDLAPKLPLDDVKPGDTWKHTVSYEPQLLKGGNKAAVQRLDYTYTYVGVVDANGRNVYRVTADLDLNTDLAPFFKQLAGTHAVDLDIKAIKLSLKSHIDFDLDMQTRQTLKGISESTGGFSVTTHQQPGTPLHEERLKGRTIMKLVGRA
jgi:hypothetical protein